MGLFDKLFKKKKPSISPEDAAKLLQLLQAQQAAFQQGAQNKERNTPISQEELMQIFAAYFAPNTDFYAVPGSEKFTATGSLLGTYITDKVEQGEKPDDKRRLSPAVSLSWRPFSESTLRIRASYKDIFRVPTFTDLYYLRMGNTNLKPEETSQYNVGVTWSSSCGDWLRHFSISADGYYNTVKDKIVALPTMYVWKMMNMGEVDIKGVDVNLSTQFRLPLRMSLLLASTYSFQYAVDVTDPEAKNYKDQIPYTPRHSGTVSVTLENPWVNVSYILTAVGDRYALPQNIDRNRIDSYIEQSISINRDFRFRYFGLRLQGELLNLANVNYDVIQYYPMPGRSWRLSICLSY